MDSIIDGLSSGPLRGLREGLKRAK